MEQAARLIKQIALIENIRAMQVAPQTQALCQMIMQAEANFGRDAELTLSETLRSLCQNQDTVDVVVQQAAVYSLAQALCSMLAGEETGAAMKASQAFTSLIKLTEQVWSTPSESVDYARSVE